MKFLFPALGLSILLIAVHSGTAQTPVTPLTNDKTTPDRASKMDVTVGPVKNELPPLLANVYDISRVDQPPKPIHQERPPYPFELRKAGITGSARIVATVTRNGDVTDASILDATDIRFGQSGVQTPRKWTFQPARKDGRTVSCVLIVPFSFNLAEKPSAGKAAYSPIPSANTPTLSESDPNAQGNYVPPRPIKQVKAQYPRELRRKEVQGVVMTEFTITAKGDVEDVRVIETPHELLGIAAQNALVQWKFKPASRGGNPMDTRLTLPMTFSIAED